MILLILHAYEGFALHDVDELIAAVRFLGAGVAAGFDGRDGGLAAGGTLEDQKKSSLMLEEIDGLPSSLLSSMSLPLRNPVEIARVTSNSSPSGSKMNSVRPFWGRLRLKRAAGAKLRADEGGPEVIEAIFGDGETEVQQGTALMPTGGVFDLQNHVA